MTLVVLIAVVLAFVVSARFLKIADRAVDVLEAYYCEAEEETEEKEEENE